MADNTQVRSGTLALADLFTAAKERGRPAFLPYYPIGFPDFDTSLDIIQALADEGVDGFEIGMPFSDPLADGPTIQAATQVALENGVTIHKCLDAVETLRGRGVSQPMLLMGYLNPLLAYGFDDFARDAHAAGADGFIIPDLPPEEATPYSAACAERNLALPFFLAPTSNAERMALVAEKATGFIYVVSLTGVTGARAELPPEARDLLRRARGATDKPLVLGFGISQPQHVRALADLADGYIVGSALVKVGQGGVEAVRALAAELLGTV